MRSAGNNPGFRGRLLSWLERKGDLFWGVSAFLWILGLGLLDYLTGPDVVFSFFYLIPVSLIAWYTNRPLAIMVAILSAITWLIAEEVSGHFYRHPLIPF